MRAHIFLCAVWSTLLNVLALSRSISFSINFFFACFFGLFQLNGFDWLNRCVCGFSFAFCATFDFSVVVYFAIMYFLTQCNTKTVSIEQKEEQQTKQFDWATKTEQKTQNRYKRIKSKCHQKTTTGKYVFNARENARARVSESTIDRTLISFQKKRSSTVFSLLFAILSWHKKIISIILECINFEVIKYQFIDSWWVDGASMQTFENRNTCKHSQDTGGN